MKITTMHSRDRNPSATSSSSCRSASPTNGPSVPSWMVAKIEDRIREEYKRDLKSVEEAHHYELGHWIQQFTDREDALKKALAGEKAKLEHQEQSYKANIKDLNKKLDQSKAEVKESQDRLLELCKQGQAELAESSQQEEQYLAEISLLKSTIKSKEDELNATVERNLEQAQSFQALLKEAIEKSEQKLQLQLQDVHAENKAKEAEYLAEIEKLRETVQRQKEQIEQMKDSMLRRDKEDGDVWIKRENALVLQLPTRTSPSEARQFEKLLQTYVEQHKSAVESSINLKQWCLQHNVKLISNNKDTHTPGAKG